MNFASFLKGRKVFHLIFKGVHEYISFGFSWQHLLFISELESWNVRSTRGLKDFWVQWFLNWALQRPGHLWRSPTGKDKRVYWLAELQEHQSCQSREHHFYRIHILHSSLCNFVLKFSFHLESWKMSNLLQILNFTIKASRLQERCLLSNITILIAR